jgi:hypothetical protein
MLNQTNAAYANEKQENETTLNRQSFKSNPYER